MRAARTDQANDGPIGMASVSRAALSSASSVKDAPGEAQKYFADPVPSLVADLGGP
jgi:hypothetical protein